MNKSHIIFTHGGGRLANQLTNFGHLIALVEEYKDSLNLTNIAFWSYNTLFESTKNSPLCNYPATENSNYLMPVYRFISRLENNTQRIVKKQIINYLHLKAAILPGDLSLMRECHTLNSYLAGKRIAGFSFSDEKHISLMLSNRKILLAGYPIRNWTLFKKHQHVIKNYFQVEASFRNKSNNFIQNIRNNYDYIIGVLIRRNDYKTWSKGKYYFEFDRYFSWINKIEALYSQRKAAVVITSDENIPGSFLKKSNYFKATGCQGAKGHYIESFHELSLCDLVVTPPSTFGIWAAFLGNIPILPLCGTNCEISGKTILKNHIFDAIAHEYMSKSIR